MAPQILPIARLAHDIAECPATVSVRNLSCTTTSAHDAWGRPSKPQPLLVSASVSFSQPFADASATDTVSTDTVHYGQMSKAIKAAAERAEGAGDTLNELLGTIWKALTGWNEDGYIEQSKALVDIRKVGALQLEVFLPKASLMGEGVGLKAVSVFGEDGGTKSYGRALRLQQLRVPVLIGVNSNERDMKQIVVADVEVDRYDLASDEYTKLEKIVVRVMDGSSFETLEALAALLAHTIMAEFSMNGPETYEGESGWQVRISLEKPSAVPFAEGPAVQIRAGAGLPKVELPRAGK